MKLIIKNLKLKYLLLTLVFTFFIVILNLFVGLDPISALKASFGGYPFDNRVLMIIFILFVFLLQSINLENIKYIIDNEAYLMVRYGSRTTTFNKLLKVIFISNLIVVLLILVAHLFSMLICGDTLTYTNIDQVFRIALRGYLTCLIISSIQLIMLIKYKETVVFYRMTVLAVVLIIVTRLDLIIFRYISILPSEISGLPLIFNIVFCLGLFIFCTFLAKKEYNAKEIF